MKNSLTRGWLLSGVFVLASTLAGCAGSGEKSGAYVDDTWITSKVKSEMISNKSVDARDISVSTTHGVVTLSGRATNLEESNKAAEIAQRVNGVKQVENDIRIK